ncbi:DUF6193 family natural product biosynthesis protein [Streptomyces sp. NPDC029721]|uniref:DUF6193 family natural product biosynthesis protein n=1 Tax=Streptomyces sp. NPDC029721 TaxID=3157090 RepID=UPI0033C622C5
MVEETLVERTWRGLLERHPAARRGEPAVIEAAYAEPRLRALFPFPSHGALSFHRNTQFPWKQRPAVHRGRCAIMHRVCASGRAGACPGRVTHTA